ncbi:MAG: mycofactocin-coupled SDR family oxidoreductase [Acidimicrobiales bacterium]
MSGTLAGKVALVTGGARAQGRSHAVRLAVEGADVVVFDICAEAAEVDYTVATTDDIDETVHLVEAQGRRCLAHIGDVRDPGALDEAVGDAVERLGGLDVVVANAGISTWDRFWEMSDAKWQAMIDINLTGVWRTFKAAAPVMIEQARGGSLIAISSVAGLKSLPGQAHYSSAKHGIVGLVKSAALELGPFGIRVNSIHPWGVVSPMGDDPTPFKLMEANPTFAASFGSVLPGPTMADPEDISNAVVYLASDASRCVTGIQLPVDMGATIV